MQLLFSQQNLLNMNPSVIQARFFLSQRYLSVIDKWKTISYVSWFGVIGLMNHGGLELGRKRVSLDIIDSNLGP